MKTFLFLFFSLFSLMCFANEKEIKLVNIGGVVLVSEHKEYKVASNNKVLKVNNRVLVTQNSTVKILYKDECQIDIPENSMVDIYNTCEKTKDSIISLNKETNYSFVENVVAVASVIGITTFIVYQYYHDDNNNDNNISLE